MIGSLPMRTSHLQLERTPTTLVVRQTQLPQGCWLTFGAIWLVLTAAAGCFFLLVSLLLGAGFVTAGWRANEFLGTSWIGLLILGLVLAVFIGFGVWMTWMGLRCEHLEAHVWTFDKVSRMLTIAQERRDRSTRALRVEHIDTYPLPAPGSVQARRIDTVEGSEYELVVTIGGKTIRGMRQRGIFGNLRQAAQEINDFLAT